MPDDGAVHYQYQSLKVIRGREARTIAKMQAEGWELHTQTQGRLRTDMTFRRMRKPVPWRLIAAGSAVVVVVVAIMSVVAVVAGGDEASTERVSDTSSTDEASPTEAPSEDSTDAGVASEEPAPETDEVLTVENSRDFERLLSAGEDPAISAEFARNYAGRRIKFDGAVFNTQPYEDYDTRFQFLIYVGDFSETDAPPGPSFQFRDVSFYDLQVEGPGNSVGTGDELRIVAEVVEFEARTGLFLLDPVSTRLR